jgi:hypothetical protein
MAKKHKLSFVHDEGDMKKARGSIILNPAKRKHECHYPKKYRSRVEIEDEMRNFAGSISLPDISNLCASMTGVDMGGGGEGGKGFNPMALIGSLGSMLGGMKKGR